PCSRCILSTCSVAGRRSIAKHVNHVCMPDAVFQSEPLIFSKSPLGSGAMSNTPTKTPSIDREAAIVLEQYEKALDGLQNDIPQTTPVVYKQTSYTVAPFLPVMEAGAAPLQAVAKARSDLKVALTNRHAKFEASKT